jgi:hypothetical protein
MSENEYNQHQEETQNLILPKRSRQPRWKRLHHSWIFWVFLLLMFLAIMYYVTSVDFAFAPR